MGKNILISFFLILLGCHKIERTEKEFNYIITEVSEPNSLDPLEADRTNNITTARMLYLTPIEISSKDELFSTVLSSFTYDKEENKIIWQVKEGITFDDGSLISAKDVAFSVLRMIYAREKFPVIRYIKGIDNWKKNKYPLQSYPEGIKIDGNQITFELTKHLDHPLYRFTLELFSIIPQRCVDLKTNKIICKKIPVSGHYQLVEKWKFKRREQFPQISTDLPNVIKFTFLSKSELILLLHEGLDNNTVVASSEEMLSRDELEKTKQLANIKNLALSRFYAFLLNPSVKPFDRKECRQFFSQLVRKEFDELSGSLYIKEHSIFTKIVSGYLSKEELKNKTTKTSPTGENCQQLFSNSQIDYIISPSDKDRLINQAIINVANKLRITLNVKIADKDYNSYFCNNESAIYIGGSGFWPLDPIGDIQMMLTPKLHRPLDFITNNEELQRDLKNLDNLVGEQRVELLRKINQNLYDESLLNVYQHFGRIFITNKEINLDNLPISITAPAPWQVFKIH